MIDVSKFGTREMPLRPSSLTKLLKCPMSVLLTYFGDSVGSPAAQTGNLVHRGVEVFHSTGGDAVAAREAMAAAVDRFPEGNRTKAAKWLEAYITDPTNQSAAVTHAELPVELDYRGVYLRGTLDQIRVSEDGVLLVWDLKTGDSLTADEAVAEYQAQQACYVLAARQTLSADVRPGGIILAAGYDKRYGRRFLPMGVDLADCEQLLDEVVREVEAIRRGERHYRPNAGNCAYCPLKQYPNCKRLGRALL